MDILHVECLSEIGLTLNEFTMRILDGSDVIAVFIQSTLEKLLANNSVDCIDIHLLFA